MRKQELVQLHALCVETRRHFGERHDFTSEPFTAYEELGLSPTSIQRRKDEHKAALFRILDGLTTVTGAVSTTQKSTTRHPPW